MSLNKFNAAYSHCTPTKHDRILNGETYIRLRVFPRKMGTKVGENGRVRIPKLKGLRS